MKNCPDFAFVSPCDLLGLREHHFCLVLPAFLSTHPAVTNRGVGGRGSRLTVSLKAPAQTPGEKRSGCFYEQHLLSPPSLHPRGPGSALFCCFCHGRVGQWCTPPAASISPKLCRTVQNPLALAPRLNTIASELSEARGCDSGSF